MPARSVRGVFAAPALRLATGLALVALLLVPAIAAAQPQYRGVDTHSLWWDNTSTDMNRQLDLARGAGSNAVRLDVSWADIEAAGKGQINSSYVDRLDSFINGANSRGIKIIATLWATPCWASSAPDSVKQGCANGWYARGVAQYPPTNPSDYGDAAKWLTSRYGSKLAGLEVWNEPMLAGTRFWNTPDKAGDYARLVRAAYPGAKAGDPSVPVLAGSIGATDVDFLKALYGDGIKGYYDGLAVHPYADPGFLKLSALHAVQAAMGDDKPVWITEFGFPTGTSSVWSVSEAEQAASIKRSFAALDKLSWVRAATVYDLRDDGTDPATSEDNFGLVRRDYTPKASYAALKQALSPTGATSSRSPAVKRSVALRLRLSRSAGRVIALGTAPARSTVRLRLTRCSHAAGRLLATRSKASGRFRRALGRFSGLRGCHVTASLRSRGARARSAAVR